MLSRPPAPGVAWRGGFPLPAEVGGGQGRARSAPGQVGQGLHRDKTRGRLDPAPKLGTLHDKAPMHRIPFPMHRTFRHLLFRLLLLLSLLSSWAGASLYEELSLRSPATKDSKAPEAAEAVEADQALVETALGHCRAGETSDALRILFRIESSTTSSARPPGPYDLRLALLYTALGLGESDKGRAAAERAMSATLPTGPLASVLFSPGVSAEPGSSGILALLRAEVDADPSHALRETLFLAQLCDTVHAAAELAGGRPVPCHALLEACVNRSKPLLSRATDSLRQALMLEALLQKWPRTGSAEAKRLKLAVERLKLAESALLDQVQPGKSPGRPFEAEAAKQAADALHRAFSLAVLAGDPFAAAAPGEVLQHTFPALGLRPLGPTWTSWPVVPSALKESWEELHFELCQSFVRRFSNSSDRALIAQHMKDVAGLIELAAKLRPSQVEDVRRTAGDINANVQRLNEETLAARRAQEEARRQREEARRAAQAAAEAEQRRRQEAEAYARAQYQQPQQRREPEQRWRWCMRCAGTGTYSQYSTRQGAYGGYERVQGQVRCDRCWGTGKLP